MDNIELLNTKIGSFYVDKRDQFVTDELSNKLDYSPNERLLYQAFLNKNSKVLWLGAHIGAHVVPIANSVEKIFAFEANPQTYKLLKKNLDLNNCSNVFHYNLAANDKSCKLDFICNVKNTGGSKRTPKKMDPKYIDDNPTFIKINAVKLDEFLKDKKFDFIFMDIEGSEESAMRGMPRLISQTQVLVSEFLPHHLKNVAGVSVNQFYEPLKNFKTMVIPSFKEYIYGKNIFDFLNIMFEKGIGDPGLIFHKELIKVDWNILDSFYS
jgi:FkbM family methyltransferase